MHRLCPALSVALYITNSLVIPVKYVCGSATQRRNRRTLKMHSGPCTVFVALPHWRYSNKPENLRCGDSGNWFYIELKEKETLQVLFKDVSQVRMMNKIK